MQISIAILVGNNQVNIVSSIIFSFKTRIATDGGVFEAEACLNALLTNLNNI
jgi:hypothetical protein